MGQIFLGKPLHWLLIVLIVAVGWIIGAQRLHVSSFNLFTVILLAVAAAAVAVVIVTSRPDERITRDPMDDEGE